MRKEGGRSKDAERITQGKVVIFSILLGTLPRIYRSDKEWGGRNDVLEVMRKS
jgi:hypothetical protein